MSVTLKGVTSKSFASALWSLNAPGFAASGTRLAPSTAKP
jgi:hypothetical protein